MGGILCAPVRSQLVLRRGSDLYRVGGSQMQGFRPQMEDAHAVHLSLAPRHPEYAFVGVYDGHAGSQVAKLLGRDLHHRIAELDDLSDESLQTAVVSFDERIGRNPQIAMQGSTCVFCLLRVVEYEEQEGDGVKLRKCEVTCVNVGDSRAMIVRKSGECCSLTEDHKPTDTAEQQRIERAGGFVSAGRVDGQLAMSRALGDFMYKRGMGGPLSQKVIALPDVTHETMYPGDSLLVVCDGVVERIENEDVVAYTHAELLRHHTDPARVCCSLIEHSLRSGSTDNHSALLIQLESGTDYQGETFMPGPFVQYATDPTFRNAYLANAREWGVSDEVLRRLTSMPQGRRESKGTIGVILRMLVLVCFLWCTYNTLFVHSLD
eukprot:TRINITY_DN1997_c0_g1_i1.p1 TRINITY_DN1997_c0_g1~~TRINITY_DN1997_c0_g1_i1.p1  ORF type:complete len:377 (+),score=67.97 TRINITY_DN1997_c0_g1_i1:60-1190(+)